MNAILGVTLVLGLLASVVPVILFRRARAGLVPSSILLVLFGIGAITAGADALISGRIAVLELPHLLPDTTLSMRVDALSGFFLVILGTLVAAVSVYALRYLAPYAQKEGGARLIACGGTFILAMAVALTATNTILFLVAWELMSLASYGLVVHHHHARNPRRAGFIYLVMTHAGTAFILFAFLAIPPGGADPYSFASLKSGAAGLSAGVRTMIFACFLIGFGTKAGMVPLHIWLPRAHPEAPSHASALMSGVMIKIGIYGLIRFGIELLGQGPAAWGAAVLVIGAVSSVVGVLYALMEHDLKRLLAFHSVENIGIILMGLGASMLLTSRQRPELAALALGASLLHTFNHAVFKGLLFLGAGVLQQNTGTRNIEKYGGLIHRMPWTAAFFLIGCLSISGLPPFNGFVSEWLTYQALIGGAASPHVLDRVLLPLVALSLALTGGLAAACFVKAFGISFLAKPRSAQAAGAHEAALPPLCGMGVLALLCVALGVLPAPMLALLAPVTRELTGASIAGIVSAGPVPVLQGAAGTFSPSLLAAGLLLFALAAAVAARPRSIAIRPTWGCGIDLDHRMEYTSSGFAQPIRQFFRGFYRPREHVNVTLAPGDLAGRALFPQGMSYEAHTVRFTELVLYKPIYRRLVALGRRTMNLQSGSLHLYLLYVLITALILLLRFA